MIPIAFLLLASPEILGAPCPAPPESPQTLLIIDPGHGGAHRGGWTGKKPDRFYEDAFTYDIARRLAREALSRAWAVAFTVHAPDGSLDPSSPDPPSLATHPDAQHIGDYTALRLSAQKASLLARLDAGSAARQTFPCAKTVWVSVHADATVKHRSGPRILVPHGTTHTLLANAIGRAAALAGFIPYIRNKVDGTTLARPRLVVLREGTISPRVLVETGNLRNPEDFAALASASGRERIARAIADGIATYLAKKP